MSGNSEQVEADTAPAQQTIAPATRGFGAFMRSHRAGHLAILIAALFLCYLFLGRGMRFFLVPSSSMEPTLLPGDMLVTLKESDYQRGDIVVLEDRIEGGYIVKRIVGLPGDTVMVNEGALYVNGHYVSEPYVKSPMGYVFPEPAHVPGDGVFVLGDNRNNSEDSSDNLESEPMDEIVGRVRFRYYPYNRAGAIGRYPFSEIAGLTEPEDAQTAFGETPATANP